MSTFYGKDLRDCKTASDVLTKFSSLAGYDGYYTLYPQGPTGPGQVVYCDMTTDGGGYMLIARSHPSTVNLGSTHWGWRGGLVGSVKDFTQAYQTGWWMYWNTFSCTFTSFIFGNRLNLYNNKWGPYVFKQSNITYSTFLNTDTNQGYTTSVLKYDLSVQSVSQYPGMQSSIGYPITGTFYDNYFLRDCCTPSVGGYGGNPTGMTTVYCGSSSPGIGYSGPWCAGSSYDGSGNFNQTGSGGYGGTNQYMIMVK